MHMPQTQHKVVIIGGGFAGLAAAKALKKADAQVTLIDRRNHHVFQPLLYQVATGGLSPADISAPIRGMLSRQKNARVLLGEVTGIDAGRKELSTTTGVVQYDTLIVATGASHSYFGHDQWAEHAPGLKTIEDATSIRRKVLLAFESAELAKTDEERMAWLTFVIVGAGPTGVEMAGAIAELARQTLKRDFRSFDPSTARVLLVEAGPRVLGTYSKSISPMAEKSLTKLGVEVRTGALVTGITGDGVTTKHGETVESIPAKTVIWGAGVAASPLGKAVAAATGCQADRVGRVVVEPDLSAPGHPEIFVIGDLASSSHQDGQPLRGTADVAGAEGKYVGKLVSARLKGKETKKPFHFRDLGKLAVIGRSAAVADLPFIRFGGYLAWQVWLFAHILKLVGYRNRATVLVQWAWNYFTRKKSARLITGALDWDEIAGAERQGARSRDNAA
jgi:NADH dehydrogenase